MAGDERWRAGQHVAPRQARYERQKRVHLATLQLTGNARTVLVQRTAALWADFGRLTQRCFEPPEQLAHEIGLPRGPGGWPRGQVMRDRDQAQQAEPLAVANAGCKLQEQ